MKILVTGAVGFVGRHLTKELRQAGHDVIMTGLIAETLEGFGRVEALDISSREQCDNVIRAFKPDAAVHLAGLAHTTNSEKNLNTLFEVNVVGAANVSRAMSELALANPDKAHSLLFVSSAFVYGGDSTGGTLECDERAAAIPRNKYGESKLAAEHAVRLFEHRSCKVYVARPFNHIGPNQDPSFVVSGFAARIRDAQYNGTIETGDLTSIRDFTDVRDIVRGYRQILELSPSERIFVFGSGQPVPIQEILDNLIAISGKNITPKVNPLLLRPKESASYIASTTHAAKVLGWKPEIKLIDSLNDIWIDINRK